MLFRNALIRVANAKAYNDCFTTNLIKATCWKQCGCVCHTEIPACLILASSSSYANYFVCLCFGCCFIVEHIRQHSLNSLDHSFNGLAYVHRIVRAPFSCKTLKSCKWKSRKLGNLVRANIRIFIYFISSTVCNIMCIVPEIVMFNAYVSKCIFVCWTQFDIIAVVSVHFCYWTWAEAQRYFKFCDICKWTF